MKNFIENVVALFKEKYDAKSNEVKTHLIDLPPDIKPSGAQVSHNDQNRTNRHHDNGIDKNSFDDNHVDSDDLDNVDSLATFILSSERSKEYSTSSNHTKGRWVTKYESITIHNRTIEQGFFYFGGQLETLVGYGTEPSLIDERLSVSPPSAINSMATIYSDESLGYWPTYGQLSALCRGIYLDWLASDRTNPHTPIGYVFIYFNGLERRVIESISIDNVSDDEFIAIYNEAFRLHNIYGKQSSFHNYSVHFLEFMALVRSPLFEERLQAHQVYPPPASSRNLTFKMQLAKTVTLNLPIPATLAWEWLIS